eukprot:543796-Prorocentrum_lima.AAC.1
MPCLLPPVVIDAKLLRVVADLCHLQQGHFWLEGPQSRPIGNWNSERKWRLTDGMQVKVRPRLRG